MTVYLGYMLLLNLAEGQVAREGAVLRKVGDPVFVTRDNYGSPATIIEVQEGDQHPPSHYKVRQDDGQEFWAFDYEVSDA